MHDMRWQTAHWLRRSNHGNGLIFRSIEDAPPEMLRRTARHEENPLPSAD